MAENTERFVRKSDPPQRFELSAFLGEKAYDLWQALEARIAADYPDVFEPDWINGGQKHGWGLRYKKSKAFCTLVPERGQMAVALVFGTAEREKMDAVLPSCQTRFCALYAQAPVYHDGKWMLFPIETETDLDDVMAALKTKRRPKRPAP